MNTDELKKRFIRGFIRPPYFYIPVKEEQPADTLIHYVVSRIANPLTSKMQAYARTKETYDVGNHNDYEYHGHIYPDIGPAQLTFGTPQGRLWIQDEHDPVFSAGETIREYYMYERADYIYVCKIYNKTTYLGYFVPVYIDIGSGDEEFTAGPVTNYVLENQNREYMASANCRLDKVDTIANESMYGLDNHAQILYYNNSREPTLVDLEPYEIEGGSENFYHNFTYLDEHFQPTTSSEDRRYQVMAGESGIDISNVITSATSSSSGNVYYIGLSGITTRRVWQSATANGIDLSRGTIQSWRDDVQVDIPAVEQTITEEGNFSSILMYSGGVPYISGKPIYNDLTVNYYYSDPSDFHSFKTRWSGGDIPIADDTRSVDSVYLGDGLTREICAQYQTIFATGDYASVGATGMVIEIET